MKQLIVCATLASAVALGPAAQAQPVLPLPSYDNTVYVLFDAPGLTGDDASFQSSADQIFARVAGGPYGRLGMSAFLSIDMAWDADLASPSLLAPSEAFLDGVLARAQTRSLAVHLGAIGGISRWTFVYDPAKLEDRRNCQWYSDGALMRAGQSFSTDVWMTPSRYARKLRRHLEAKTRLVAQELVSLRKSYPDTLVSASGDGEMELNKGGFDKNLPYESQVVADYSPFAILEFRDWIQHAGLYAPGQVYDGQGYSGGGSLYQGVAGLALFNQDFGTALTSWSLRYFDWSLSDPVDADPRAIPASSYDDPGWMPMPTSGPDYIAGGFDAPRGWNQPSVAFWQLWLVFRQEMIAHSVQDFSSWILSTAGTSGEMLEPERWYSHQIPGDYLNDTFPGCADPDRRLLTSASAMQSAVIPPPAGLGLTSFDRLDADGYHRTSRYLFDDLAAMKLINWGLVEYSPSWTNGALDTDVPSIAGQIRRAYDAGAHILSYEPWPHFQTTPNPEAFSLFLSQVRGQPRDSGTVAYEPPSVAGLSWSFFSSTISLFWNDDIFSSVAGYGWADWPDFDHFEIWRGTLPDFTDASGELVRTTTTPLATGIAPDAVKYYRVRAISRHGKAGELAPSVLPVAPGPANFYTLAPCRLADTRGAAGPALAPSSIRVFAVTGACAVPAGARAISANVTVVQPSAPGHMSLYPGDVLAPLASTINFAAGAVRANNALLSLSEVGELAIRNASNGTVDVVLDVNGYFQ